MNKRLVASILILVTLVLLTGCGKSVYQNDWVLHSIEDENGIIYAGAFGYEQAEIDLDKDNTGLIVIQHNSMDDETSDPITWSEDDSGIKMTGSTFAWTGSLNDGVLDVVPYEDNYYSKLHFVTKDAMAESEENADVYYSVNHSYEYRFLDNGLFKDTSEEDSVYLYQNTENGYRIDTISPDAEKTIIPVDLVKATDKKYGDVLLIDGAIWACKDKELAKAYFDNNHNDYVGKWTAISITNANGIYTPAEEAGLEYALTLNIDGFVFVTYSNNTYKSGKWGVDNGDVVINDNGMEYHGTINGDTLTMHFDDYDLEMLKEKGSDEY